MNLIQFLKRILNFPRIFFNSTNEYRIFIVSCLTGFVCSLLTFKLLNGFPYEIGKNLIGVFITTCIAIIYMTYAGYKFQSDRKILLKTTVLFLIQIIPFIPLFFQVFQPTRASDFSRYYLYARNMFENNTLWGGDGLFWKHIGMTYVTQPGYRYVLYLELLVFRDLYRIIAFVNVYLLIVGIYSFQRTILQLSITEKLKKVVLLLVVLFTPFAIKNSLMGMPEWITALLLMGFCYFYIVRKNQLLAVGLLALVPFFRQNILLATLLLFVWVLLHSKMKLKLSALFLLVLFLPLYHNLYYAGQWKFLVDIFEYPFYTYNAQRKVSGYNIDLLINNIIHYFGVDIHKGKLSVSFIAILFLPLAVLLFFIFFRFLPRFLDKIFYFLITMSAVGPVILVGNGYYPRFEFVNVVIMLTGFVIIYFTVSKSQGPTQQLNPSQN